jgi:5-methylcytosine-specific restriction endonuclease McrA
MKRLNKQYKQIKNYGYTKIRKRYKQTKKVKYAQNDFNNCQVTIEKDKNGIEIKIIKIPPQKYCISTGDFKRKYKKQKANKKTLEVYTDYYQFLKSKTWRILRDRVFKRDKHRCIHCGKYANQVHHKKYSYPYGSEKLTQLESVCGNCHAIIHEKIILEPVMPEL